MIDLIYRYDPKSPLTPRPPTTPAEARRQLCEGNLEFIRLVDLPQGGGPSTRIIPIDLSDLGVAEAGGAPRQEPFAAVLACSDARVPTEFVFNQGCNDLFVVRVAGHVLGHECLGSLDYAVQHLGEHLKLLVVLGHSGCGAVTAAVDIFRHPTRYLAVADSQALRSVVDGLLVPVRLAAHSLEEVRGAAVTALPGYRAALVETAVALNAALTARTLAHEFEDAVPARVGVVYGVYHLATREVNLALDTSPPGQPALFDPPADEAAFARLGHDLAASAEITRLLGQA